MPDKKLLKTPVEHVPGYDKKGQSAPGTFDGEPGFTKRTPSPLGRPEKVREGGPQYPQRKGG